MCCGLRHRAKRFVSRAVQPLIGGSSPDVGVPTVWEVRESVGGASGLGGGEEWSGRVGGVPSALLPLAAAAFLFPNQMVGTSPGECSESTLVIQFSKPISAYAWGVTR